MVRPPSFDKNGIKSGVWSKDEDDKLRAYVLKHGHHNWRKLPSLAGLARSGKSCRLRWVNYLQPGLKKGKLSKEEVDLIIRLHNQIGNKWSAIAEKLPGRTDNDIKNQWHAHIKKRGRFSDESFEMNCCKKNNDQEDQYSRGTNFEDRFSDSSTIFTLDDYFKIDDLPNWEKEVSTLGLCHMSTDLPPFPDQEEFFEITYDDQSQTYLPHLIQEDQSSTLGLCHNNTPIFCDSSYTHTSFNIHLSSLEEEYSTFGLCYNDTLTYDRTCFNNTTPFPVEKYSDLGLCYNDTPTF